MKTKEKRFFLQLRLIVRIRIVIVTKPFGGCFKQEVPMNRNSFGMSKSEIIVQMNNLAGAEGGDDPEAQYLFGGSPGSDRLPEDPERSPEKQQETEDLFGQKIEIFAQKSPERTEQQIEDIFDKEMNEDGNLMKPEEGDDSSAIQAQAEKEPLAPERTEKA